MTTGGFQLDLRRDAGTAVRELARREAERAQEQLTSHSVDAESAIHEFRKSMKALRALARLVRGSLGEGFRPCNRALRDAARHLADLRDEDAVLEALRALDADEASDADRAVLARAEQELSRRSERPAALASLSERAKMALQTFEPAARALAELEIDSYMDFEEGLRRTYRSARARARAVDRQKDDVALHELRKRVKDHRFHLDLLLQSAPTVLGAESALAHEASELLGNDHDLVVLAGRLDALRLDEEERMDLKKLIQERRKHLQARALDVCTELLDEEPKQRSACILRYVSEFVRATTTNRHAVSG